MEDRKIDKYNIPGPRYTSYPTVPYWNSTDYNLENWKKAIVQEFWTNGKEISLYIHLPFCESLCTYCACNKRITKNHRVESQYISTVMKEWKMYIDLLPDRPILKEIHLGGGTPTFFHHENLSTLIQSIRESCHVPDDTEFSFEAHPDNTTSDHLKTLFGLGFKRLSLGIQDFDPAVQKLINRKQTYQKVEWLTHEAREIGFRSINYDLVYGLPGQTVHSFKKTLGQTISLKPDRIALYGYAHVPKTNPAQRAFEHLLPAPHERANFYKLGKSELSKANYHDVGMDHFVLPIDDMYQAHQTQALHRNFMGYTTQKTTLLIGLGVSAIGDAWSAYSQNEKNLEKYYECLSNGKLPLYRGHILSNEDLLLRKHIMNIMCSFETRWMDQEIESFGLGLDFELLDELESDGFIQLSANGIKVTEEGKPFVRNICMAFDIRMNTTDRARKSFSKTI